MVLIVCPQYSCKHYVRSCCPCITVCLSVCSVKLCILSICLSALMAPRQIPAHLFFLAIRVSLLLYSESGSHLPRRPKMELILWPTIEFDNEKKMQYLYDCWDCVESDHFIALLMRANQGGNECYWNWCSATCCKCDKLALVVCAVFHRDDPTWHLRGYSSFWQGLWKIMTAILHQHSAMPTAKLMTNHMMQSYNALPVNGCHTALNNVYFSSW